MSAIPTLTPNLDPKTNWAINNMSLFPVEINRADYEMLLRVPASEFALPKKSLWQEKLNHYPSKT